MIEVKTYLMKSLKDRDKEKYPIVYPEMLINNHSDFFIPLENEEEIMAYFSQPQNSNKKFINSVMVIKNEGNVMIDFDMYTVNVWFDYLVGIREFLNEGKASFNYGSDPVIPMEFKLSGKRFLFTIDKNTYVLTSNFLWVLINEINQVILTLRKLNIYRKQSKLYTIPNLITDIQEMKMIIKDKYQGEWSK